METNSHGDVAKATPTATAAAGSGGGRLEFVTQAIAAKLQKENAKLLDRHAEAFQEKVLAALMTVLNDQDVQQKLGKAVVPPPVQSDQREAPAEQPGRTLQKKKKKDNNKYNRKNRLSPHHADAAVRRKAVSGKTSGRTSAFASGKPKASKRGKKGKKVTERFEGAHPFKPTVKKQSRSLSAGPARRSTSPAFSRSIPGLGRSASPPAGSKLRESATAPHTIPSIQRAARPTSTSQHDSARAKTSTLPRLGKKLSNEQSRASTTEARSNAFQTSSYGAVGDETYDDDEVDEDATALLAETRAMLRSMGVETSSSGSKGESDTGRPLQADNLASASDQNVHSPVTYGGAHQSSVHSTTTKQGSSDSGGGAVVARSKRHVTTRIQRNRKKAEFLAVAKARRRQQLAMIGDLQLPAQADMGQLPESEWENEIAKSILSIYHANLRKKIEDEVDEERKAAEQFSTEEAARVAGDNGQRRQDAEQHPVRSHGQLKRPKMKKKQTTGKKKTPPPPPHKEATQTKRVNNKTPSASLGMGASFKANTAVTAHLAGAKDAIVTGRFDTSLPGRGPAYGGKVLRRYRRPMIWFGGSGKVKAVWCALAVEVLEPHTGTDRLRDPRTVSAAGTGVAESNEVDGSGKNIGAGCGMTFCNELTRLEKKAKYNKYIAIVEAKLRSEIFRLGPSTIFDRLWRQLVVTCVVFGYRCCETGAFNPALKLLRHAQELIEKEDAILTIVGSMEYETLRRELFAYVFDTFAFYYWKRDKSATAIQYAKRALSCHRSMGQPHQIAKCKLHIASAQAKSRDHKAALRTLGEVLKMVDDGRLETTGTSAEKLCLVVRWEMLLLLFV